MVSSEILSAFSLSCYIFQILIAFILLMLIYNVIRRCIKLRKISGTVSKIAYHNKKLDTVSVFDTK